jgi:hypothetical protein
MHRCLQKGMTPIAKNISVTDELGQHYESTYFKRANGLVKHGRARWLNEQTICLACPPIKNETEDSPMEEKVFNYIKEQIEYLKDDLNREVPLNLGSEFQPEAAAKIYAMRIEGHKRILELLNQLTGREPKQDDRQIYRQMLERIANDRAALDAAKETACEMDDEDCKADLVRDVCTMYEATKKEIAAKLIEKLG